MKKLLPIIVGLTLTIPQASAAPKPITPQLGSIYSAPTGSEFFIQSGRNSLYLQNVQQKTSDILITARDLSNSQVWQKTIDSGVDEVVTAVASDSAGNLWIAGAASTLPLTESYTPIDGIDNPDLVIVETATAVRSDLNKIALWKISSTGELLSTYYSAQNSIPIINSISIASSGISMIGELGGKQIFITATFTGTFSKPVIIGTTKTQLTSVLRNSDGSSYIVGNSSETLAGKKVAGVRDGIIFKVSKTGSITSLLRSSASKAVRSWNSLESSLLLTGPVVTGKAIETAITKFTTSFAPTWTTRIPSVGPSVGIAGGGNYFVALSTKSQISGISWKPTSPSMIVITFDNKGLIKAAHTFPGLVTPLSLQFTRDRGVVGMASGSDGLVSIFTLASR